MKIMRLILVLFLVSCGSSSSAALVGAEVQDAQADGTPDGSTPVREGAADAAVEGDGGADALVGSGDSSDRDVGSPDGSSDVLDASDGGGVTLTDAATADAHDGAPDILNAVICLTTNGSYTSCNGQKNPFSIDMPTLTCPAETKALGTCSPGTPCTVVLYPAGTTYQGVCQ